MILSSLKYMNLLFCVGELNALIKFIYFKRVIIILNIDKKKLRLFTIKLNEI